MLFCIFIGTSFWSTVRWLEWPEKPVCELFTNGTTACNVSYDYMHCKYLGRDLITFGSIMFLLVYQPLPSADPKANLAVVWKHLLQAYKTFGITERKLAIFQRKGQPPKMKGRAGQHLEELRIHRTIRTFLKINIAMEQILADHKECLPGPIATQFTKLGFAMMQIHLELQEHFLTEDVQLFPSLPKQHTLLHVCLQSKCLNPKLTWCFKGEDLQNISRTLASSCSRGLLGPQVVVKMLSKLRIAWRMRLTQRVLP